MSNKKKLGAYYTPKIISDFMVGRCLNKLKLNNISLLEPSVGDGIFVQSLNNYLKKKNIQEVNLTIIETEKLELVKARNQINQSLFSETFSINTDFLEFALKEKNKYSLVIGNPPYIKKNYLSDNQKILCKAIHQKSALSEKEINNIWTAFVVASHSLLDENGILAFVLPADLLQVKYAQEIRVLLEKQFERLEIFTVNKKLFKKIDQQIVILFAYKKANKKGVFFFKFTDLNINTFNQISSNGLLISDSKWTHYHLTEAEIKLLNSINQKLPKVSNFISSNAGIVTGANNYFILPQSKVNEYNLENFCKKIIQKSSFVNGSLNLTKNKFNKIIQQNKQSYLLSLENFENIDYEKISNNKLKEYLEIGITMQLNKRYKCSKRKRWYIVPNIKNQPKAFFFKRSHLVPKLIKNSANVYVTDAAYNVDIKENYHINDFIYSFYNIVTLIFAELLGRKYGGGVLELTPNEFKSLPIQYLKISKAEFLDFTKEFEKSSKKIDLISRKSELTLRKPLNINKKDFNSLLNIYFKLIKNRMNTDGDML
ncbi:adenine-specific DNA-methyltransferase [Candidatus Magnetomoraceae bacterium gMMP-15]